MFPSPRDFPDPGVESMSPTLQAVFIAPRVFTAEPSEKPVCTLSYTERSLVIYFNCKLSWVSWFCWLRWWFGFLFLINLAALPRANLDSKIIFYHLPSLYGLAPSIMLSLVSPSVNGVMLLLCRATSSPKSETSMLSRSLLISQHSTQVLNKCSWNQ